MLCDNFNFNVVNLFFRAQFSTSHPGFNNKQTHTHRRLQKPSHKEKIKCENKKEKWFWLEQEKFTHKERNDISSSRKGVREGWGAFFITCTSSGDRRERLAKKLTLLMKITGFTPLGKLTLKKLKEKAENHHLRHSLSAL